MSENKPVCLVTGANSGIGYAVAMELARNGCEVVMVCRNKQRGEKAQSQIINATHNNKIHLYLTDLSSQQSIQSLATTLQSDFPTLNILINNASAIFNQRQTTVDGLEQTFALNHMAYYHLTNALLPILQENASARIINIGSFAAKGVRLNFDDLQGKTSYDRVQAYQTSKLANILFTTELARRLNDTSVTVNCYNPGNVMTNFGGFERNLKIYIKRIFFPAKYKAMNLVPVEQTGKDLAYLALDDSLQTTSGQVFSGTVIDDSLNALDDETTAMKLWDVSESLLQYPMS